MLVRIRRHQVRIGMFVERLEGTWLDHPFWSDRFLLAEAADVAKLKDSGVSGVVIDLSKGVGATEPASPVAAPVAASPPPPRRRRDERTARLLDRSRQLVADMFGDIAGGRRIDVGRAGDMVDEIAEAMRRNPLAVLQMTRLKTKDACTYQHSVAVCALMVQFARYLGMDEETSRTLGIGGLFHDIGKVAMPARLLAKAARLSDGEMTLMRGHPAIGHALLSKQDDIPCMVREICLSHHERMDGRGYPNAVPAADLDRAVRMASICDVYDAVTSTRPYKAAWSSTQALGHMLTWTGQFDDLLLLQFAASFGTRLMSTRGPNPEAVAAVA